MATEFSDIYIDGLNTEELYADGGQIVEAWLDGECIWKLTNKPSAIVIYLYTWYEGKFYAIGDVYTKNQYGYTVVIGTVFIGNSIEHLTANETNKTSGLDTSEKFAVRIHCDINGVWVEKNDGRMQLHSGFAFNNPPDALYKWFDDNATLNIPKTGQIGDPSFIGASLSVGATQYFLNSSYHGEKTYVYKRYPKEEIETLETGSYINIFTLDNKAIIVLYGTFSTNLDKYIWENAANTINPQYKYPIMYIRNPLNWGHEGTIYFPLGKLYQEIEDSLEYPLEYPYPHTIELKDIICEITISNEKSIYSMMQIYIRDKRFYFEWRYNGEELTYSQISIEELQFCLGFTYYNVGTKFLAIRKTATGIVEGRIVKSILDTIYTENIFSVDTERWDWEWNLSFATNQYLYIPKSNYNQNKIRWLKVDLQTMDVIDETVEIGIKEE